MIVRTPQNLVSYARIRREVGLALRQHHALAEGPTSPDALPCAIIPSCARGNLADRVLAEVDQDGFIFATDPVDRPLFDRRRAQIRRNRHTVQVVLVDRSVRIRKHFRRRVQNAGARAGFWNLLSMDFYREAAALMRLRDLPGIPTVRRIDAVGRMIEMDFIWGENQRHRIAAGGEPVHDLDIAADPALSRLSTAQRTRREIELFSRIVTPELRSRILALAVEISRRGVAPGDVHPANFVVGAHTGAFYWIDFELVHLEPSAGWRTRSERFHRTLREILGPDPPAEESAAAPEPVLTPPM